MYISYRFLVLFLTPLFFFSINSGVKGCKLKKIKKEKKKIQHPHECSTDFKSKNLQRLFAIMFAVKVYGSCMGSSNNQRYFTALSW